MRRLAILLVLALLGCEKLEDRLIARVAQQATTPDHTEWLDDGELHVILCGTGSPMPSRGRVAACTAVLAGGHFLVVDVGPGSVQEMGLERLPLGSLDGVLLTHFHSDHIGELGEVGLQSWARGRPAPLPVYGPPGVARVVSGFDAAYELDTGYRTAHHGAELMPPATRPLVARPLPVPSGGEAVPVLEDGDLRVEAFLVDHAPVAPAYGYRIDYRGRSVVISGDTAKSANVARYARGVDLLVHEALAAHFLRPASEAAATAGLERRSRILGDVIGYHTTPVEAAEIAAEAGVGLLVFTHVVPSPPNALAKRLFMRGVGDAWAGEVVLGDEGMHFRLPAGSGEIVQEMID